MTFSPSTERSLNKSALGAGGPGRARRRQRVACLLFPQPKAEIAAFAEACFRFSPQVAIRPLASSAGQEDSNTEAVFIEIGGSAHLFSEQSMPLRLTALCQRFNVQARVAIADDAPTALAMARFGQREAKSLPLEALSCFLSPFRHDADLERRALKIVESLRALGLNTLEDFSKLPTGTLASRFGKEGFELSYLIQQSYARPWPLFRLPERVSEKADLFAVDTMEAVHSLESVLFVLRTLTDRAMSRLRARGLRASVVELELGLDRRTLPPRRWTVQLPLPQGSSVGLIPILRERLAGDLGRKPLEAPVVTVRFDIVETAPGHGSQANFFHRREEESEAWDALVGRLTAKLGQQKAFVAQPVDRHLPERAWRAVVVSRPGVPPSVMLTAAESRPEALTTPERPSRLLKIPEPMQRLDHLLVLRGHVARRRQRWKVVDWQGPERLSGEWWSDPAQRGVERDYYRATTDTGERLWVFTVPGDRSWYLHGFFD